MRINIHANRVAGKISCLLAIHVKMALESDGSSRLSTTDTENSTHSRSDGSQVDVVVTEASSGDLFVEEKSGEEPEAAKLVASGWLFIANL